MNLFDYRNGLLTIKITKGIIATESGLRISSPILVCRLMNQEEMIRAFTFNTENRIIKGEVEEEICRKCILWISGLEGEKVDIMNTDAGVITTIYSVIERKSLDITKDLDSYSNIIVNDVTQIEIASAMVSNMLNIPYQVVEKMPVSEVAKKLAIVKATFFPKEQESEE